METVARSSRVALSTTGGRRESLLATAAVAGLPDSRVDTAGAAIALMVFYMVVLSAIALGVEQRRDVD